MDFDELLKTHWIWQKGVLISEENNIDSAVLCFSPINSEYFNLAIPNIDDPRRLDLVAIEKEFVERDRVPSFYLTEDKQKKGLAEYLVRKGYSYSGGDTWMAFDVNNQLNRKIDSEIKEITQEKFDDYYSVLSRVFSDFSGNDKYLEICKDSISGKVTSNSFKDFRSELYLIYDSEKPAAGCGMFYSKEGDFAYLHDAGTLEEFRGKGYQNDLIKYRVNKALEAGITRIYSIVELGGQSWKNMIKNGFSQKQLVYIISKKK